MGYTASSFDFKRNGARRETMRLGATSSTPKIPSGTQPWSPTPCAKNAQGWGTWLGSFPPSPGCLSAPSLFGGWGAETVIQSGRQSLEPKTPANHTKCGSPVLGFQVLSSFLSTPIRPDRPRKSILSSPRSCWSTVRKWCSSWAMVGTRSECPRQRQPKC